MKTTIFSGFAIIILLIFAIVYYNDGKINTVKSVTILDLQQQQKISGTKDNMSTEFRYLVITDKETFICESSIFNGKFDNSNIFYKLQKGKVYNFKVCGVGKSFLFDYRNILDVVN